MPAQTKSPTKRGSCLASSRTGLDVAAVQGRAALHELIAQQPRQIVEELTADRLFLGGLLAALFGFFGTLGFFFCLFVAVHAEADGA